MALYDMYWKFGYDLYSMISSVNVAIVWAMVTI